jgi:hypothetical protein
MNNKIRKNSESFIGMSRGWGETGSSGAKEQPANFNAPEVAKRIYDKYRKGSCQLEPVTFLKSRKQSSNEEPLATTRTSQLEPVKAKRRGWD